MGLLITNALVVANTEETGIVHNGSVAIEGTTIRAVGASAVLRERFADLENLDAGGRLLMPGLVNTHMHFYGTYARGLALPGTPRNFPEILEQLWWRLDRSLDLDAVYYSALVQAIAAIRHGCTSVIDHHASPHALEGSLDSIEEALSLVGLRGLLCYEVSDRDGREIRDQGLAENVRYIRKCRERRRSDPAHLFDAMMGLHAAFTLEDDSLERAAGAAMDLDRGCHIHLLEDIADQDRCLQRYGRGAVQRLRDHGVLGPKSIAAHGIHLQEEGLEAIEETGTIVTHQARSNMNNAVGRADVFELLRRRIPVGIGTDGMSADLRSEIRCGYLMHKHHLGDPNLGWSEYERMALGNNPEIFRRLSGLDLGRIVPGALADLILVDYFPPTPLDESNFWGHFMYGIIDSAVDTTIINGRIAMRGKEIEQIDEAEIALRSREVAERVWKRFAG